jgi:hypothetical protein
VVTLGAQARRLRARTWYVLIGTSEGVLAFGYQDPAGAITRRRHHPLRARRRSMCRAQAGFRAVARNILPPCSGCAELPAVHRRCGWTHFTASFEIGLANGTRGGSAQLLAPAVATVSLFRHAGRGRGLEHRARLRRRDARLRAADRRRPDAARRSLGALPRRRSTKDTGAGFTAFADGAKVIIARRSDARSRAQASSRRSSARRAPCRR